MWRLEKQTLATLGELPIDLAIDVVSDARNMPVGPCKIDVSGVSAVEFTLVGIIAIGTNVGKTDKSARGIFAFHDNSQPRGRQLPRGALAEQQYVAQTG